MEKNRVLYHSLNHSPKLFDAPGTEACASGLLVTSMLQATEIVNINISHCHSNHKS